MKRTLLVSLVMTVAVAGLVWAGMGASAHTHTYPSTVTIHQVKHPKQLAVRGKVLSARVVCRHNREVQVFKKQPGTDPQVGSGNTGSDNRWGPVSVPSRGRYYAHIDAVAGPGGPGYYGTHNHTCGADTSPPILINRP